MGLCDPWANSYLHNWMNTKNLYHQILMALILTAVMCAPKTFKTLLKWTFLMIFINKFIWNTLLIPLLKIIQIKINRKNVGLFTWIQPINSLLKVQQHNRHLCHDFSKNCRERKPVCLVWMHSTDNFQSHSRTSLKYE